MCFFFYLFFFYVHPFWKGSIKQFSIACQKTKRKNSGKGQFEKI